MVGILVAEREAEPVRPAIRPVQVDAGDLRFITCRRATRGPHRVVSGQGGTVASTVLGIFMVPVFFLLIRSWFKSHARQDDAAQTTPAHPESAA